MEERTRTVVIDASTEALLMSRYRLVVDGAAPVEVSRRRTTLGSLASADVFLDDASVSRRHARIEVDERGYRLIDEDSKNGTWVEGLRVRDCWLQDGLRFRLGRVELTFELLGDQVEVPRTRRTSFGRLRGRSERMRDIFALLERVAPTEATVLIEGESGTGKELVAEAIHQASSRASGPFVVFDCSAVSAEQIESALFGHVRGAYTGAVAGREGAFEQARGGTLFIDELGELQPDLQPRLLRVLEKREVRRVGSNDVVPVDVRVVAATNRRLREEVAAGTFREDLYWRFAVIEVLLPPLRERREDIPLLAEAFLQDVATTSGMEPLQISYATMERLREHDWPGNVRELRNFIERAALLSRGGQVETRFLQAGAPRGRDVMGRAGSLAGGHGGHHAAERSGWASASVIDTSVPFKEAKGRLVDAFEQAYWRQLLDEHEWNLSSAGRAAGVHRKTVEYLVRKLGLERD